jgi:serine/threonine protein kinase
MSDHSPHAPEGPSQLRHHLDELADRFQCEWQAGRRPRIEDYLGEVPDEQRLALFRELLWYELTCRRRAGETVHVEDYLERFADFSDLVRQICDEAETVDSLGSAEQSPPGPSKAAPAPAAEPSPEAPTRFGRYRVTGVLGRGGFGIAYRGHDDELQRDVAIKVPRRERLSRPEDIEAYLKEARILASLDHAHIVPVYDFGRTEDGLCFVVSKFIEGSDLKGRIKQERLPFPVAAELVATIADALHYAHRRGLVHRDVKPANILLDPAGKPYLADFGLALREEEFGKGAAFAGTPVYMSPEQARSEGHRVDGRSDVFSLGVLFYELLTGRRPFQGATRRELLEQITTVEPRPPRQIQDAIPKELERICLKALAKRASDRYTTALDLAEDLRHFLEASTVETVPAPVTPAVEVRPVKIVPKGLRSFDAGDADFFLELLPGPRDRDALPESLRFWKARIEEVDADRTFPVGLLYGPSGCGKSSLVKAGLLPRLASHVLAIYVEATPDDTEVRLLRALGKHCPALREAGDLVESVAALRRGQDFAGKKVLLVLDQFEQWLHAKRQEENTAVVQALRQCDGGRVQALVLVRDDFWMAAIRFLRDLEIPLREGQNSAAVDLFDLRHARRVLAAFGRAYGALPEDGEPAADQARFLDQAVAGLSQDGFAEMVKGSWL